MTPMELIDEVNRVRKEKRMSQEALSALIGVSENTMKRTLQNPHRVPVERLNDIALALGVQFTIELGKE
jgi:transcriptional regulator with XRE-family HTH domain